MTRVTWSFAARRQACPGTTCSETLAAAFLFAHCVWNSKLKIFVTFWYSADSAQAIS